MSIMSSTIDENGGTLELPIIETVKGDRLAAMDKPHQRRKLHEVTPPEVAPHEVHIPHEVKPSVEYTRNMGKRSLYSKFNS